MSLSGVGFSAHRTVTRSGVVSNAVDIPGRDSSSAFHMGARSGVVSNSRDIPGKGVVSAISRGYISADYDVNDMGDGISPFFEPSQTNLSAKGCVSYNPSDFVAHEKEDRVTQDGKTKEGIGSVTPRSRSDSWPPTRRSKTRHDPAQVHEVVRGHVMASFVEGKAKGPVARRTKNDELLAGQAVQGCADYFLDSLDEGSCLSRANTGSGLSRSL